MEVGAKLPLRHRPHIVFELLEMKDRRVRLPSGSRPVTFSVQVGVDDESAQQSKRTDNQNRLTRYFVLKGPTSRI